MKRDGSSLIVACLRLPEEISPHHPVISARQFKVFVYEPQQVWDRIGYIEQNPLKERLPPQQWDFVTPYDNFPFHKKVKVRRRRKRKATPLAPSLPQHISAPAHSPAPTKTPATTNGTGSRIRTPITKYSGP